MFYNRDDVEKTALLKESKARGIIEIKGNEITYNIAQKKKYNWNDPEEWVRAYVLSYLIINKYYASSNIKMEVKVPRRTPSDSADIVVYRDTTCKEPYLVIETKKASITSAEKVQAIEQVFGNANSLRAELALFDMGNESTFYDVQNYPAMERKDNIKGDRKSIPVNYGDIPEYTYIAGPGNNDIKSTDAKTLEKKVKKVHSIIWAGGKRDPLFAFDEWSKIMLAKVEDERHTPNNSPRKFQVGTKENAEAVSSRVHALFKQACEADPDIFGAADEWINISDSKILHIVKCLQDISITDTEADTIGSAFEIFFGSIFRGELGQYFTMRPIARFAVAMLDIKHEEFVVDPCAGSGGFLLEVLLQTWNKLERDYNGRSELERLKSDFALNNVYGIEIHAILARICKINLLLHHDGHTNIEGDKSCLDLEFSKSRLRSYNENFHVVVGNPPFGDEIKATDEDQLGSNSFDNFDLAKNRKSIPSEQIIFERAVSMLVPGGRLALVLPDGFFNNSGVNSGCLQVRKYIFRHGRINAIISLPDFAFKRSGAQNKTSIIFFQKYTEDEAAIFNNACIEYADMNTDSYDGVNVNEQDNELDDLYTDNAITYALSKLSYRVFLSEAEHIGYAPSGMISNANDLYDADSNGNVKPNQSESILGEYKRFLGNPKGYVAASSKCMAIESDTLWSSHNSHRLDPKYHLFIKEEHDLRLPTGWKKKKISELMSRREEKANAFEDDEQIKVMTLSQTGEIRERETGKGNAPDEWTPEYFNNSSSTWYRAYKGDLVYSGIDIWKGCISVVPHEFDRALVTKEYPIYKPICNEVLPEFLAALLRTEYYRKAFYAITTGHSNRRRTQESDFRAIEIYYPVEKKEQLKLLAELTAAKEMKQRAEEAMHKALSVFDNKISKFVN